MSALARNQMSKPSAYPATTSYSYPTRAWTEQSPSSAPSSQTQILESTVQKPFALRPTVPSASSHQKKQYHDHAITSSPQSPKTARYPRGNEVLEISLHCSPRGHHRDYTITSIPKSPKTAVHPSRHHRHQTATQIPPVPRTPRTHQFFVPPSTPTRAAPPIPHSSATKSPRNNTASPRRPTLARPPAYRQRSKSDVSAHQLVSYGQRRVLARPPRDTSLPQQRPSTANSREADQERREREQRERAEKGRRRTEGMVSSGRGEVYGERGDFLGFERPVGAVMMKKVGKVVVVGTGK